MCVLGKNIPEAATSANEGTSVHKKAGFQCKSALSNNNNNDNSSSSSFLFCHFSFGAQGPFEHKISFQKIDRNVKNKQQQQSYTGEYKGTTNNGDNASH